jgi:hypothetical protein
MLDATTSEDQVSASPILSTPAENAAKVKATYESSWTETREAIEAEVKAGEKDLSRLLNKAYARSLAARKRPPAPSIVFGNATEMPFLAANRIARDWIADCVVERAAEADAIIELGSGFGYNLFNVWLRGGPGVPYHGLEYTEAGRSACELIAQSATDGPRLSIGAFDYHAPDFSAIAGRYANPLVYSSHSIEQIPELREIFFERLLAIAPKITTLHFEPVGWQIGDESDPQNARVKAHCERSNYNRNLWPMLNDFAQRGRLAIEETQVNRMAPKLTNSTTLIRWTKL